VQGSDGGLLQPGDGRVQWLGAREMRALYPYGMEPKCEAKLCTLDDRNEGALWSLMEIAEKPRRKKKNEWETVKR